MLSNSLAFPPKNPSPVIATRESFCLRVYAAPISVIQPTFASVSFLKSPVGKVGPALKNTEGMRATAQQECERFKTEHQKLVIDARRLEAAIAGRKTEEERLRQEMRDMESRRAAAEASMKERAAVLNEREAAVARATDALKETGERHAMMIAEIANTMTSIMRARHLHRRGYGPAD